MSLRNKRFLITGGNGFIGSCIANYLINSECKVSIIDTEKYGWRVENFKKCNFYQVDLRKASELNKCITKINPDIIFHLAGYVNAERNLNIINQLYDINFLGTKNLIMALNDVNYELLINTGSSEEYGKSTAPFLEEYREMPVSPYSASKLASTNLCRMMNTIFDKPIITVRPFLVYGPKQISRALIPSLIYSGIEKKPISLTGCEQTRDFLYVEDLVKAYITLAINSELVRNKGIFNIGSGEETPILDVVNFISEILEETRFLIGDKPYRIGETMNYFGSVEKIRSLTGWTPDWELKEGIHSTIEWWFQNKAIWTKVRNLWDNK